MQNEAKIKNSQRSQYVWGPGYLCLPTQRGDFVLAQEVLVVWYFKPFEG